MRKKILIVLVIGLVLLTGLRGWVFSAEERKKHEDLYKKLELFSDALVLVQNEYVDQPSPEVLIQGAVKGMLNSLDPYSEFLDADAYNELRVDTEGKFGGLGIEIAVKEGVLTVISPIEDTPAWKAGIKSGDRIVKINTELTKNFSISEAVKRLRGKPGTEVTLTVLREGLARLLDIKIVRDIIKIKDIKDAMVLEDGIGYIRLVEFRENTPRDLDLTLAKLKNEGLDSLIIDLRNNPGGLLDIAVKVAEKFIPSGKMIVYTKGRAPSQNMEFRSRTGSANYIDIPLVVLVNEGSASGSEIVAGAFQDYKRAVIVGKKTFGKGSVQSVLPLADGSALKLTTSKYFTPSGRLIHNLGINPDVVVEPVKIEFSSEEPKPEDVFSGLEKIDAAKGKEPQTGPRAAFDYKKDNQITCGLDIIKGIKVYKGSSLAAATKKP